MRDILKLCTHAAPPDHVIELISGFVKSDSDLNRQSAGKLAFTCIGMKRNEINAMIAMGNFAIIDTSDNSALHAGCFAIDAGDHIKLRFLEQPDAKIDMIYVRHSSHDQEGFTLTASSLNIIGRAI